MGKIHELARAGNLEGVRALLSNGFGDITLHDITREGFR